MTKIIDLNRKVEAELSPEARYIAHLYRKASPSARKQIDHMVSAYEAKHEGRLLRAGFHWLAFFAINPGRAMQTSPAIRRVVHVVSLAVAGAVAVAVLAGCGDGGQGGSLDALRPIGQPIVEATSVPATSSTLPAQIVEKPVEVTKIVEATVIVDRPVEVTRVVEIVATPTPEPAPEINGFDMSRPAVDESTQPCPLKYWKRGRCVATQAQIEQVSESTK